jgi:hypothetical protein
VQARCFSLANTVDRLTDDIADQAEKCTKTGSPCRKPCMVMRCPTTGRICRCSPGAHHPPSDHKALHGMAGQITIALAKPKDKQRLSSSLPNVRRNELCGMQFNRGQ